MIHSRRKSALVIGRVDYGRALIELLGQAKCPERGSYCLTRRRCGKNRRSERAK